MTLRNGLVDGGVNNARTLASGDRFAKLPWPLYTYAGDISTSGTSQETLFNISIPAGTLATDNEALEVVMYGTSSNTTNSKTFDFDVNSSNIISVTSILRLTAGWEMRCHITRLSNTAIRGIMHFVAGTNTVGTGIYRQQKHRQH